MPVESTWPCYSRRNGSEHEPSGKLAAPAKDEKDKGYTQSSQQLPGRPSSFPEERATALTSIIASFAPRYCPTTYSFPPLAAPGSGNSGFGFCPMTS